MDCICRICHIKEGGELSEMKCKCLDEDLKYIHMECAEKWYKDKIDVVWCGKLTQEDWVIKRSCLCEICKGFISPNIVDHIFFKYSNKVNMRLTHKNPHWFSSFNYPPP